MAMTAKTAKILRHPRTGKSMYPEHKSDVFETIEQIAGYTKYPFKLRTTNNCSIHVPDITSLNVVEQCRISIIKSLGTHKKLKAFPVLKK